MIPVGFLASANAFPDASVSVTDTFLTGDNKTVYTFTGKSFGAADSSRIVAIALVTQATVSSVTIGGVSATVVGNPQCYIAYASVPSGTTGDVVVTHTASTTRCGGTIYRVIPGRSATPFDTITDDAIATTSSSLSVEDGGIVLVVAARNTGDNNFTLAWSGSDTLTYTSNNYGSSNFNWAIGRIGSISSNYSGTFTTSTATKFTAIAWR